MALPNFKINPNIENNVNRLLESQPLSETKSAPPSPEKPADVREIPREAMEASGVPEQMEIKKEKEGLLEETIDALKQKLKRQKPKVVQIPQVRDEITLKVEKIMESGLQDAYREMSPTQQQEFKLKGEKTAMEIREILRTGKIKIKKIINLLMSWLRLLPGINKFFLEQEAKIKADKIISLKNFDNK